MGGESPNQGSGAAGAVFLSYASEDADVAERICASLQAAGIALFVASGVIVFFDLKRVFDRIDRRGH